MSTFEDEDAEGLRAFGEQLLARMTFDALAEGSAASNVLLDSGDLGPGVWQTGFDPAVSFTIADDSFAVGVNDGGLSLIQDREALAQSLPLRWLAFARPTGLATETELVEMPAAGGYSVDPVDVDTWVATMTVDVEGGPRSTAEVSRGMVGGFDATIVDLQVTADRSDSIPGGCGADRCYGFMTIDSVIHPLVVRPGERYRIWFVPDADLVVMAGVALGDEEWLDKAEMVVSTIVVDAQS